MSLLLLRQSLRQCQLSLLKRTGSVAASRFNSTDGERWVSAIKVEDHAPRQPVTNMKEVMEDRWARHSSEFLHQLELAPRNAFTGRTVEIDGGDIADAAKKLDRVLAQNGVPREWFTNRRHKQKGEERRRLNSIRHRRRFSHEVGKMVQLVQQIRRKNS